MKRSEIDQPPCYFDKYIDCIEDLELIAAFENSKGRDRPVGPSAP